MLAKFTVSCAAAGTASSAAHTATPAAARTDLRIPMMRTPSTDTSGKWPQVETTWPAPAREHRLARLHRPERSGARGRAVGRTIERARRLGADGRGGTFTERQEKLRDALGQRERAEHRQDGVG